MPIPQQGDRVIIKGIPDDYPYANLYEGPAVIKRNWFDEIINKDGSVYFLTGYLPYKDGCKFSCSGCGNSVPFMKMRFIETKPATFWRFKDGIQRAGNRDCYEEPVGHWEVDFEDIL